MTKYESSHVKVSRNWLSKGATLGGLHVGAIRIGGQLKRHSPLRDSAKATLVSMTTTTWLAVIRLAVAWSAAIASAWSDIYPWRLYGPAACPIPDRFGKQDVRTWRSRGDRWLRELCFVRTSTWSPGSSINTSSSTSAAAYYYIGHAPSLIHPVSVPFPVYICCPSQILYDCHLKIMFLNISLPASGSTPA